VPPPNFLKRELATVRKNLWYVSELKEPEDLKEVGVQEGRENTVLIVSHREKQCGIYQYGANITRALQKSSRYAFAYAECTTQEELHQAVVQTNPSAIIYNYYPATMPWLTAAMTRQYKVPQLGVMHEVTQREADEATPEMFDYHLCPDPTLIENNPYVLKTLRLIPSYLNYQCLPERVTIGSFGFGFGDKGFERLVETVQQEFDEARIRLHIPFNPLCAVDVKGRNFVLETTDRCRGLVFKPGIKLDINHEFLTKQELLDFLGSNTINAFFYDAHKDRGISSCIEYALAVQRPIAITRCGMFRHVSNVNPSICIEDSSLKQIIENGVAPLVPFYNDWSKEKFILNYEQILDRVLAMNENESTSTLSHPLSSAYSVRNV
jgi:hypothetical protein